MHTDKIKLFVKNITYMYPNIAVIQLFTLSGIKFALIMDTVYEYCACTFVRSYVQYGW
jgi:hypothetical protein